MTDINLTLASDNDKGFTVRTSQFPQLKFDTSEARYYLEIKGLPGVALPLTLSRNGETLYTGAMSPYLRALVKVAVGFPSIGNPLTVQATLGKQMVSVL